MVPRYGPSAPLRTPQSRPLVGAGRRRTEAASADRLVRLQRERTGRSLADELDDIALACAALPVVDTRSADEIIGYDDAGLPA